MIRNPRASVEVVNNDPSIGGANAGGLVIFPILGVMAYGSLLFLLKDKFTNIRDRWNLVTA